MARTKQTARKSTGGRAPRKQLATCSSSGLRQFMTSQQTVGTVMRAPGAAAQPERASYLNHENVMGAFGFATTPTSDRFAPQYAVSTVANPQTGLPESWLSIQFASKFDGDGFRTHRRPPIALVVALDISGSMGCGLDDDNTFSFGNAPSGQSKLCAAKSCLLAILGQLDADDTVGVVLFNHEVHQLHESSPATAEAKAAIATKLERVQSGGGTRLEAGFVEGMRTLDRAAGDQPLRRCYFLTDMQSHLADEQAVLRRARERADAVTPLHTTVVGMGVDLSVGTVEALSSLPGGRYASVSTVQEFERAIGEEFSHDVVPLAFGIRLSLEGGWAIERACGSAELNALSPGSTSLCISSEFASPHNATGLANGGVILLKLRSQAQPSSTPSGAAAASTQSRRTTRHSTAAMAATAAGALIVSSCWTTIEGQQGHCNTTLSVPALGAPSVPSASLRKALALVRFVDLQKSFCDAGDSSESDLEGRSARLEGYKAGREDLLSEMAALGDSSILPGGENYSFLQTLEQIIEMETAETNTLKGKRKRETDQGTPSRPRRGRRAAASTSSEPPKELICPITHSLMADPVTTADGHAFERSAIETWFRSSNLSPLTGLPLESKTLTPNHGLRSLAVAFAK